MGPHFQLSSDQIKKLLDAGRAAPSPANLQAWRVRVTDTTLELSLDEKRASSFLDIEGYASIFALGAFAENIALTADQLGLLYQLKVTPNADTPEVIAHFYFTGTKSESAEIKSDLHSFIFSRCTNRRLGDGSLVSEEKIRILTQELLDSDLGLKLCAVSSGDQRPIFEKVICKGELVRFYSPMMRAQMFGEICWSDEEAERTCDRVALNTLELPAPVIGFMRFIRKFPAILKLIPQSAMEKSFLPSLQASSHLCCISMNKKCTPSTAFAAGRRVQRLWLRATQLGLSIHAWSILPFLWVRNDDFNGQGFTPEQKATLSQLKSQLTGACNLSNENVPVFLFRLFQGPPPTATALRRPIEDFSVLI